jgi:hypothetical protein
MRVQAVNGWSRLNFGVRGQSLVEFALVLPMLLVLLLGIADFGRVFAAGITLEALSRNAAEAAALEYLQVRRAAAGTEPSSAAYDAVLLRAYEVACHESETMPNHAGASPACTMPVVGACIHDEWGDHCRSTTTQSPSSCTRMGSWPPTLADQSGGLPYAYVASCYEFTTLLNLSHLELPFAGSLAIGDIWMQRERSFAVADY